MLKRFLIAGLAAGALCAPAVAEIRVSEEAGVWTVSADGESLDQVAAAFSEQAGFRLSGGDRLAAGPGLNGAIEGDLRTVAERLLRGRDYAFVFGETPETADQLQRVVILSGRIGDMPATTSDARPSIPETRPVQPLTEEEAERVSSLLARQIQPLIDAEDGTGSAAAVTADAGSAASAQADPDLSTDELDAETQAALAAATQQARADLQALVNALQEHERNGGVPD